MTEDYYDRLGISRDADREKIEQAYREAVSQHHPDVSDDPDAEERFKDLQQAKDVLTDEDQRRAYDRLGHDRFEQREHPEDSATRNSRRTTADVGSDPFGGVWADSIGGMGVGGFGDLFDRFFGHQRSGSTTHRETTHRDRARHGEDITASVDITLEDAYHGVERQVSLTRSVRCPDCSGRGSPTGVDPQSCSQCNGRGHIIHIRDTMRGRSKRRVPCDRCDGTGEVLAETCDRCGGDGLVRLETEQTVTIPAGVESGQTIRIDDKGHAGRHGGSPGDLLVDVDVRDHPTFDRDGADLYRRTTLSFPQAALGDTVRIQTLDGAVELQVPSGTQSGETFRLAGAGMPHFDQPGRGDLYVQTDIVTPEELSEVQRQALETFAEASGSGEH